MNSTMKYQADNLKVLKGLEPVKQTPAMFIGDTNVNGLHQIIWEPLDNSIDEALAGHCSRIEVILDSDGYVTIKDNGRGIPVDIHKKEGVSGLELVLTRLHAGGKFKRTGGAYKTSGGLHGVGVSCTNALSEHLIATVEKDKKMYQMEFKHGFKASEIKVIDETKRHGTSIKFKPDPSVFEVLDFDQKKIEDRLKQSAYLNKGLKIVFSDQRDPKNLYKQTYHYEDGLREFLEELVVGKETLFKETLMIEGLENDIEVRIALNYLTNEWNEKILSFANNINTREGGTHVSAINRQLSLILNKYCADLFPKKKETPTLEDYKQGLITIVSVKIPNPRFQSQTKDKLVNSEVSGIVGGILKDALVQYFDENPLILKKLLEKAYRALEARVAARKARESIQKGERETFIKNEKFIDCNSREVSDRELFIVEGDSAGGSARTGRNKETQAILSLRGKPQNTQDLTLGQVLNNNEFNQLIGVMGCGIQDTFTPENLRYDKIIIMADADVDGSHISILLLTFFFKYYRELIEAGKIYVAAPPLYSVKTKKGIIYLKDDNELSVYEKKHGKIKDLGRFKGLGEMNADQLADSTMNPANRILIQVTIDDVEKVTETFHHLMGKMNAQKRREVIEDKWEIADIDI